MSSRSQRTKLKTTITTRTGRVVYNRKPHMFSERDAARVTREALNFIRWDWKIWQHIDKPWSPMNNYALMYLPRFLKYAFKFNFFPLESMFYQEREKPANMALAEQIAQWIATKFAVPELLQDLAYSLVDLLTYSQWGTVLKIKPGYAQLLVDAAVEAGTITMEDVYGPEKRR